LETDPGNEILTCTCAYGAAAGAGVARSARSEWRDEAGRRWAAWALL